MNYLAIDIGGTKIEVCLFDHTYTLIESKKYQVKDFRIKSLDFIDDLKNIIREFYSDELGKLGISFNCAVNDGVILYSSLLGGAVNYNIKKEFETEFSIEVVVDNDVNCMAKAEYKFGQAQGIQHFVLLNLGTGIRVSNVFDGKVMGGFQNVAGEVSQKEIMVPELNNKVFKIDNLVSGQGIAGIYALLSGNEKATKEIFEILQEDDFAQKAVAIFIKYLGQFLQDIYYFYNPELIILNGSLKKASDIYMQEALEIAKISNFEFFESKGVKISNIDHGACLGALC